MTPYALLGNAPALLLAALLAALALGYRRR
jgi:hypothetical protein